MKCSSMKWPLKIVQYLFVVVIWSIVAQANPVDQKAQAADKPLVNNVTPVKDPKCLLPMETGPCRMSLLRFYYNAGTDTCEEFTFGGCKGNRNLFGFKQTCEETCKNMATPTTHLSAGTLKTLTYSAPVTLKPVVTTVTTPKPQNAIKH